MPENRVIFDMDGTLYPIDRGSGKPFGQTRFGMDMRAKTHALISERTSLGPEEVKKEIIRISQMYGGLGPGIEPELGIPRIDYVATAWDLQPGDYIDPNPELRQEIADLRGRIAVLTAAPSIWASRVLAHLDIEDLFDGRIFTGYPNKGKPDPAVFKMVADSLGSVPEGVISIGDSESSDIVPAKSIGMKAVRIGQGVTIADFQAEDIRQALGILRGNNLI